MKCPCHPSALRARASAQPPAPATPRSPGGSPRLLLFQRDAAAFSTVVNYEIVAEEIVRTLVASIGLILAVPITTAITCLLIGREAR